MGGRAVRAKGKGAGKDLLCSVTCSFNAKLPDINSEEVGESKCTVIVSQQ